MYSVVQCSFFALFLFWFFLWATKKASTTLHSIKRNFSTWIFSLKYVYEEHIAIVPLHFTSFFFLSWFLTMAQRTNNESPRQPTNGVMLYTRSALFIEPLNSSYCIFSWTFLHFHRSTQKPGLRTNHHPGAK